ncbi:MAG TPA: PLP-dependent cysteine synthase family protein [Planctomycetes bacterium]|nr:PLP-dependent cysteine synthase family protein [Planctomycetota bacterium]
MYELLESTPVPVREHFRSLAALIGRTPLYELRCRFRGGEAVVYAKAEAHNFTGSIKDRMALFVLVEAYRKGEIEPGRTIVEATSGNTGIALAALGRALGHPVRIYMPDWMSRERVLLLESFGADIVPVSAEEGGFRGSLERVEAWVAEHGGFLPHQFESEANVLAHAMSTGPEILAQMASVDARPDAFVAGVGTGGTVMGVGRFLREEVPGITIHPLEPADSPTLRTGHKVGKHRIQGISDEFIPEIVKLDELDEIVDVHDGDAIRMAQRLAGELGIGVGISSGANLLGALQAARRHGAGARVATVFADDNKKYLSTDLAREEPEREDHLTPEVEFLGCRVIAGGEGVYPG